MRGASNQSRALLSHMGKVSAAVRRQRKAQKLYDEHTRATEAAARAAADRALELKRAIERARLLVLKAKGLKEQAARYEERLLARGTIAHSKVDDGWGS